MHACASYFSGNYLEYPKELKIIMPNPNLHFGRADHNAEP